MHWRVRVAGHGRGRRGRRGARRERGRGRAGGLAGRGGPRRRRRRRRDRPRGRGGDHPVRGRRDRGRVARGRAAILARARPRLGVALAARALAAPPAAAPARLAAVALCPVGREELPRGVGLVRREGVARRAVVRRLPALGAPDVGLGGLVVVRGRGRPARRLRAARGPRGCLGARCAWDGRLLCVIVICVANVVVLRVLAAL